jgi:hypothetical protein
MTDEVKEESVLEIDTNSLSTEDVAPEANIEEAPKKEEPKYTKAELDAMQLGWIPPDKFTGDKEDYRTAKEYLMSGQLFKLKRETEQLRKDVKVMVDYNKQAKEMGYKQAVEDLKRQIKEATEVGDIDTVQRVSDQLADVKAKQEVEKIQAPAVSDEPIEVAEFKQRNDWFNNNTAENYAMTQYAIAKEKELRARNPNLSTEEALRQVETEVKKFYPHRFENANQHKPSPVIGAASEAVRNESKKLGLRDLTDEERTLYNAFKTYDPKYSIDDFIKAHKIKRA